MRWVINFIGVLHLFLFVSSIRSTEFEYKKLAHYFSEFSLNKTSNPKAHYALLEHESQEKAAALTMPETLQDPRWEAMYKNASDISKMMEDLEKLIRAFDSENEEEFLIKALKTLAPALKKFEKNELVASGSTSAQKICLYKVEPCVCCNVGRYHFSLRGQSSLGPMHAKFKPDFDRLTIDFSINGTSMKNTRDFIFGAIQGHFPQLGKKMKKGPLTPVDLRAAISILAHEMAHLAYLDCFPAINKAEGRIREARSDLVACLILQSDDYFKAMVQYLALGFLSRINEQMLLCYHLDKDNIDSLLKIINLWQKDTRLISDTGNVSKKSQKESLNKYIINLEEAQLKAEHDPDYIRLQNTLTCWAAYLIHVKKKSPQVVVKFIAETCGTIFGEMTQECDLLSSLLFNILELWATSHYPK